MILFREISPADSAKYDSTKTLLIDNLISKIQEESDINIAKILIHYVLLIPLN